MIHLSDKSISALRLGSAPVAAAYLGDTKVWAKAAPPQEEMPIKLTLRTDGTDIFADIQGDLPEGYEICRLLRGNHRTSSHYRKGAQHKHYGHRGKFKWCITRGCYELDGNYKLKRKINTERRDYPRFKFEYNDPVYRYPRSDDNSYDFKRKVWMTPRSRWLLGPKNDEVYVSVGVAVYERRKGGKGNGKRISNVSFFRKRYSTDENGIITETIEV